MSSISITTPGDVQHIVQRNINNRASIPIAGLATFASNFHVEADWKGRGFNRISTLSSGTNVPYSGTLTNVQALFNDSQGVLTVRIEEDHSVVATYSNYGIGDIFPCLGQSNMFGMGDNGQSYSNAHGLKACFAAVGGAAWSDLVESAGAGSFRPLLATKIMQRTGFPCGFIMCAASGTPISGWLPSDPSANYTNYIKNATLLAAPAGTKCALMHEGESDCINGTSQSAYKTDSEIINAQIFTDLGIKTMACELQTMSTGTASAPNQAAIRAAIGQVWDDGDPALTGPDLSGISVGLHLTTDADLLTAATLWFDALVAASQLPALTSGISRSRMFLGL